jgi:integrase/recombinase XerC
VNWQDFVAAFLSQLATERRLSAHTVDAYRRDLEALLEFAAAEGIGSVTEIGSYDVRRFAAQNFRRGLSPRSIARRLSAVRSFFAYLVNEGIVTANAAVHVQAPKPSRRLPAALDTDQVAQLLERSDEDRLSVRDRAMFELMYSSGLRLAELVQLDVDSVDLSDATVRVTGKGSKARIVPVGRVAIEAVRQWLTVRAQLNPKDLPALFLSQRGSRLAARSVQARLNAWAKNQGSPVRVHPHMLRHSFASHLLESSGDLRAVQELLGHASISTTQAYTHLDFQHLATVYDKAHPRARRRDA